MNRNKVAIEEMTNGKRFIKVGKNPGVVSRRSRIWGNKNNVRRGRPFIGVSLVLGHGERIARLLSRIGQEFCCQVVTWVSLFRERTVKEAFREPHVRPPLFYTQNKLRGGNLK
jgi:hypothetical protein